MRTLKESTFVLVTLASILVIAFSCRGRREPEPESFTGNRDSRELVSRQVMDPADYPIPTSVEITEMLYRAGAPYILGISNPSSNADKYFTEFSKALNLGVYGADLSYAATYEMNQEIRRYLQVSKQLIDDLNISTAFNRQLVEQVETNIEDKDSLIVLVADSFYDTYDFLTRNQRDDLSLLVMAGSWIEGMYITSQIALGARDNSEITDIILRQDEPLEILLSFIEQIEISEDPYSLYDRLSDIYDFLKNERTPMPEESLERFTVMVEDLRNDIVKL